MAFFHHGTFVIAFAVRMGEHKLSYLLTYLLNYLLAEVIIRPPVYGSNGRTYKMLVMFFFSFFLYSFATRSPRSHGRSP